MDFAYYVKKLREKILSLTLQLKEAIKILDTVSAENERLEKRVKELESILEKGSKKVVKKTSRNSNLPPSKDISTPKRKKSLRKKSSRKSGGQVGHKGHFLEMSANPNKVIPIVPKVCDYCGSYLDMEKKELVESKQEIDIPPIEALVYQYDSYQIKCNCGNCTIGNLPDRLKAKVQYGPRIRSLINYMSVYQYVPYKRATTIF